MDEASRAHLLGELDRGEVEFLAALAGVSEEEASFRTGEASWSILDCVEHAAAVETMMCRLVKSRYDVLPEPLVRADFELKLARNVVGRRRKVEAPEMARPRARFTTLAEAVAHFRHARAMTRHYAASCTGDLRSRTVVHPFAGTLTCFECLLMVVAHPLRHAAQIREIREQWLAKAAG